MGTTARCRKFVYAVEVERVEQMSVQTRDPWTGGACGSLRGAQLAFDRCAGTYTDDEIQDGIDHHNANADDTDSDRVESLDGEFGEICAWYWRPAIAGDHAPDQGSQR